MKQPTPAGGPGAPAGGPGAPAGELTGLEFMRAIAEGRHPPAPIADLLGMRPVEVEVGRVVFALEPDGRLYNPIGSVHGGVVATLLDSAMSCAVHTTLPAGIRYTTVQLNVHFVRGVFEETGEVRAVGEVVASGRRMATAEGRLVDPEDRVLAHGTLTCLILAQPGADGGQ